MALSRIYLPSISLVLEEERHWFIPEPSSVFIPLSHSPSLSSSRPRVDSDLMKPVNLGNEELEGDEHFSFVVHFPEDLEMREEYDEVGRVIRREKRPSTSRGLPACNIKSCASPSPNIKIKNNISSLKGAVRKAYQTTVSATLLRKLAQRQ